MKEELITYLNSVDCPLESVNLYYNDWPAFVELSPEEHFPVVVGTCDLGLILCYYNHHFLIAEDEHQGDSFKLVQPLHEFFEGLGFSNPEPMIQKWGEAMETYLSWQGWPEYKLTAASFAVCTFSGYGISSEDLKKVVKEFVMRASV